MSSWLFHICFFLPKAHMKLGWRSQMTYMVLVCFGWNHQEDVFKGDWDLGGGDLQFIGLHFYGFGVRLGFRQNRHFSDSSHRRGVNLWQLKLSTNRWIWPRERSRVYDNQLAKIGSIWYLSTVYDQPNCWLSWLMTLIFFLHKCGQNWESWHQETEE